MKVITRFLLAFVLAATVVSAADRDTKDKDKQDDRLKNSGVILGEILNIKDSIPQDLMDKAKCVVVIPSVLKAAFIVGGSYGRGTVVCRNEKARTGSWGAPAMMVLEGGSVGFQIGGEATDFVMLIMNDHGVNSLLHSKVKLGGDVSVAAGPVGRTAEADTDAYVRAEILTYSRARGAFAGVSLEGASLRPDEDANEALYGRKITASAIVMGPSAVTPPPAAHQLIALLDKASPTSRAHR
ncbi:MAG TPA: lipid-binding SYLF domain-containing protein [Candidatus Acidoferrales bacterium]|jgi:lipid-binding SYLF domain-containing protein|nr:lipid-binding SYLF domain-containing protein [Candidatus Acidoferrales bacterium]